MDALSQRDVRLVHACQLKDFCSYLNLGGVPSRGILERTGAAFTAFDTDDIDHTNGVWDQIFFNLSDFGDWFGRGKNTLPNPYGPIALVMNPEVLSTATDVSITLRSAGANGFDRAKEGIPLAEVPKLFVENDGPKRHVKFTKQLEEAFPGRAVTSPELNCTFPTNIANIDQLRFVLVDNYPGLAERVRNVMAKYAPKKKVLERFSTEERKITYQFLWDKIGAGIIDVPTVAVQHDIDGPTKQWCDAIASWDDESFQFRRFAKYLRSGTIYEMTA